MENSKKNCRRKKGVTIFLSVFLALVLVGGVTALIGVPLGWYDDDSSDLSDIVVKDDSALYIGTFPYSSLSNSNNKYYVNRLYVNCFEDYELVDSFSFRGDQLVTASSLGLEGDYEFSYVDSRYSYGDILFADLSSYVYDLTRGLGLTYWSSLSNGNYFEMWTEFSAGPISSLPVVFNEAGIYLINIPTEDGAEVDVEHADVYIKTVEVYE